MKFIFTLAFLLFTCCLTLVGYAQKVLIHPYVGGSINFIGISNAGWGIDAGVKYGFLYAGVEYGIYGVETATVSLPYGETYHSIYEDYYGVHGGLVFDSVVYFGLVLLHSDNHEVGGDVIPWFNVGPDVRVQAMSHMLLALAYTIRRGFNLGLSYLF